MQGTDLGRLQQRGGKRRGGGTEGEQRRGKKERQFSRVVYISLTANREGRGRRSHLVLGYRMGYWDRYWDMPYMIPQKDDIILVP